MDRQQWEDALVDAQAYYAEICSTGGEDFAVVAMRATAAYQAIELIKEALSAYL